MRSRVVAVGLAALTAGSAMLAAVTSRAEDESRVRVEYDPPHVSVAATEVGLGELLSLIGAKVGFSVAEGRAAMRPVTVSIASASVDDVLRQLLRAENHTILYRQGADARVIVDRIVLLGAPAEGVSTGDPGRRASQEGPPVASSEGPTSSGAGDSATTGEQQVSMGNMLQSHAVAGRPPVPAAVAEPAAPSAPPSPEERLSTTPQQAEPGSTSLGESQARATRSLEQAAPAPATGR